MAKRTPQIFICYAHKDNENLDPSKRWLNRLLEHLAPLELQGQADIWSDQEIELGEEWHDKIQATLQQVKAAVLLVSPSFLASKYIRNSELPVLLKNAKDKGVIILPILLRQCLWRETQFRFPDPKEGPEELSLSSIQVPSTQPLNSLKEHEQDEVLYQVTQRIYRIVNTGSIESDLTRQTVSMTSTSPTKKRILLLSANPRGTGQLRLDEEMREIKEGLRRAKKREQFVIESAEAVRYRDIRRAILDYEPQIVHFSGHGISSQGRGLELDNARKLSPFPEDAAEPEGLVFEDETGHAKLVNAEALAGLFELFADQVECVVLNACYSEVQAMAIAQHINYVIGMSQAIGDRAAIEFAVGFYDALGAGKSIEFAYRLGCNAIRIARIPEKLTPQLLTKNHAVPLPQPDSSTLKSEEVKLLSIRGVDYTKLRDLLAAGKWKEADEETATVMCQAAGREDEGWLRVEDIDNFPGEDLHTINQLWLSYSDEKFGFSVQKEIYQTLGGTNEYNWEIWRNFAARVGWRKKTKWLKYSDLIFNLNADRGHLPWVSGVWPPDFNVMFQVYVSLLLRKDL